jgi:hypothetical protein
MRIRLYRLGTVSGLLLLLILLLPALSASQALGAAQVFDVSGYTGGSGAWGNAWAYKHASPAYPGGNGGRLLLHLHTSADGKTLIITSQKNDEQKIEQTIALPCDDLKLSLLARGGKGGNGGRGADGRDGGNGRKGGSKSFSGVFPATCGEDGQSGEDGGNGTPGANGGKGGIITVSLGEDEIELLRHLHFDVAGGLGGGEGKHGKGGRGGRGGCGGLNGVTMLLTGGPWAHRINYAPSGEDGKTGGEGHGDISPGKPGVDGKVIVQVRHSNGVLSKIEIPASLIRSSNACGQLDGYVISQYRQ